MTTTRQPSLFDAVESERRRLDGMARAAEGRDGWLAYARDLAASICERQGTCSADDLRAEGLETPPGTSFNIWGSVFTGGRFRVVDFIYSKRREAHRNLIRLWALNTAPPGPPASRDVNGRKAQAGHSR